jgi:predicted NBD/HSP70 family sugar kinase
MKQMQHILPVTAIVRDRLVIQLRARRPTPDAILAGQWLDQQGNFTAQAGCIFGADVGGTKIQSVITDLNGIVLAETRSATPSHGGEAVLALIDDHMAQLGRQVGFDIVAAGIGMPGTIHPLTGYLERAPNLCGFDGCDMRALLSKRFCVPVAVENDVNFAALGEAWKGHGAAQDMSTGGLSFIALGTGIGMGLVWGDRILRGSVGAAGEIAVLPVGGDPFDPETHTCGALESVVSGAALVADYRDCGGMHAGQTLRDITKNDVIDPSLDTVMDRLAKNVALAVLSVDAIVNPSLFVFGGGIGSRMALLERIQNNLVRLMPDGMPVPDCRMSELGNQAGVLGAVRAARLAYADNHA